MIHADVLQTRVQTFSDCQTCFQTCGFSLTVRGDSCKLLSLSIRRGSPLDRWRTKTHTQRNSRLKLSVDIGETLSKSSSFVYEQHNPPRLCSFECGSNSLFRLKTKSLKNYRVSLRGESKMSNERQKEVQKKYDPKDTTLKFVQRRDDLDPLGSDDDDDCLRAEMSCGHAVTPKSLTLWCRSQLDEGYYKFRCPALAEGTKQCNKLWSYKEVRRLADLSVEEMEHFEETMARLAASEYCEFQSCPQCRTSVERKDLSNLCVKCTICTADRKKTYQFCWQCHKEWKGPAPRSDRCNNDGCINKDLELLQTCKTISLPQVVGVTDCPSVRACPTCGIKVEHSQQYCKNINCPRCHVEFCFVCLKLKSECSKTSSPYKICPSGVAPRQTSIPVWKK